MIFGQGSHPVPCGDGVSLANGEEKCSGGEERKESGGIAAWREGGAGCSDSPRGDPVVNK